MIDLVNVQRLGCKKNSPHVHRIVRPLALLSGQLERKHINHTSSFIGTLGHDAAWVTCPHRPYQ